MFLQLLSQSVATHSSDSCVQKQQTRKTAFNVSLSFALSHSCMCDFCTDICIEICFLFVAFCLGQFSNLQLSQN